VKDDVDDGLKKKRKNEEGLKTNGVEASDKMRRHADAAVKLAKRPRRRIRT
jgi:hypothetical protein